ncbi:unnamed protein product [Gadus morhua 'NCC']
MGTSALNPENATFLEKESLEPMAQLYGIKKDDLLAEVHQMRRLLERAGEKNKLQMSQSGPQDGRHGGVCCPLLGALCRGAGGLIQRVGGIAFGHSLIKEVSRSRQREGIAFKLGGGRARL